MTILVHEFTAEVQWEKKSHSYNNQSIILNAFRRDNNLLCRQIAHWFMNKSLKKIVVECFFIAIMGKKKEIKDFGINWLACGFEFLQCNWVDKHSIS